MNNQYADEIDGYVEAWLLDYTKEELLQIAMEHRVPLAPVRGYDEVRHDESLAGLFTVDFVGVLVVHDRAVGKPGVLRPLWVSHQLQELAPLAAFRRADEYVAVPAPQDAVGIRKVQGMVPGAAGHAPLVDRHQCFRPVVDARHGLHFGYVYVLASSGWV